MFKNIFKKNKQDSLEEDRNKKLQEKEYRFLQAILSKEWNEKEIEAQKNSFYAMSFFDKTIMSIPIDEDFLKRHLLERYRTYISEEMYQELASLLTKEKTK